MGTVLVLFINFLLCADVKADSCQGRCGQGVNSAYTCQCNSACLRYGDCCTDYSPVCQGETCAGRCNTEDLRFSCQCDTTCSSLGDCCTDYQEVCSQGSCSGRCGPGHDNAFTCQCNSLCVTHGDCCHDYNVLCQSNGAGSSGNSSGSDPVSGIMNDLWSSDVNRMSASDVQINTAGNRLFTSVNLAKLNSGTYQAFINLLDNYIHTIGQTEPLETSERQEVESFLDAIIATEVMELTFQFLLSAGEVTSRGNFRAALEELWFNFYSRSSSNNINDSSGFEHVMVGELKGTSTVSGFHSWIQFYMEEQSGRLSYDRMASECACINGLNIKGAAFSWNGGYKSKGSFFLGTSPEFDMAVYSICAMLYPGSLCRFTLQGNSVSIQTYDIAHKAGLQIGNSCQGRCGQGVNSAYTCQCNSACLRYADCCTDYSPVCQGETCAGRCNTEDLRFSCQCDTTCSSLGDCCTDYQEVCSQGSCSGRCGPGHDNAFTCQCNSLCVTHGDCCHDYNVLCQSNGAGSSGNSSGSDPVSGIMNDLWSSDVNRMSASDVQINTAGNRLFTSVNLAKLNSGTYQAFINLLDNYIHTIGQTEPLETSERQEVESFLDAIIATEVMELTFQFLLSAGEVTSRGNFRAALEELWFNFYSRSSSNNINDSSGFEHVMVGELKGTSTVSGFHSWIQFYMEEQSGRLSYDRMASECACINGLNIKGAAFSWNGGYKSKGSFFLGTSPEFDMAVYSICAMLYPGSLCRFTLQGNSVSIQTYDIAHKAGHQIGSAYPAI